jgi:multiple sugar transport system ATP-binding protein
MRSGKLVQVGDPLTIYDGPLDRFVGGFIGNPPMNFLPVHVERRDGQAVAVLADAGELRVPDGGGLGGHTGEALLGIRAENIELRPDVGTDDLRGRVLVVEPLGSHNLVTLQVGAEQLKAITRPEERLERDREVGVRIDPERIRWLDAADEVALGAAEGVAADIPHGAPTAEERDSTAPPA